MKNGVAKVAKVAKTCISEGETTGCLTSIS